MARIALVDADEDPADGADANPITTLDPVAAQENDQSTRRDNEHGDEPSDFNGEEMINIPKGDEEVK